MLTSDVSGDFSRDPIGKATSPEDYSQVIGQEQKRHNPRK
jgi:hypothetical protein